MIAASLNQRKSGDRGIGLILDIFRTTGACKSIQIRTQQNSKRSSVYLPTPWDTGGARRHTSPLRSPPSFGVFHDLFWPKCPSDPNALTTSLSPGPYAPALCFPYVCSCSDAIQGTLSCWACISPAPCYVSSSCSMAQMRAMWGETCFFFFSV